MAGIADRLCLALDNPTSREHAVEILHNLKGKVAVVKLNSAFVKYHSPIVYEAALRGYAVWVDLKSHDIPETVATTVFGLADLGVNYVTIHLSGGSEMIDAAVKSAGVRVKVLGITVLTSISQEMFTNELRIPGTIEEHVLHLAKLGQDNGVHGIVCSPLEVAKVYLACGDDLFLVTPGIRFADADKQDQQRVATPGDTIRLGADIIVLGRPLIEGGVEAADRALAEIETALAELTPAA